MILVVLPAVAALLPGVELNSALALVPVLNTSLVSKEIITGTYHWDYHRTDLLSRPACTRRWRWRSP